MLYSPRLPQTYGPTGIALAQPAQLAEWNLLWLSHLGIDAGKPAGGPLMLAVFKTAAFVGEWKVSGGVSKQPLRGLLTHSSAAAFVGRVLESNWQAQRYMGCWGSSGGTTCCRAWATRSGCLQREATCFTHSLADTAKKKLTTHQ